MIAGFGSFRKFNETHPVKYDPLLALSHIAVSSISFTNGVSIKQVLNLSDARFPFSFNCNSLEPDPIRKTGKVL